MKIKNRTEYHLKLLNQEKLLNALCKKTDIFDVDRVSQNEIKFECSFVESKKVDKILKDKNIKPIYRKHFGILFYLTKIATSYGLILAVLLFSVFLFVQSKFVIQYEINGTDVLNKNEIINFIHHNSSRRIADIDTDKIEIALIENFNKISFVSCMLKGQTLVLNIKEKLLPDEKYGKFSPIIASSEGKITKIELVSGTLCVRVGDIVQEGDVLVKPYTIDTSGSVKNVEANAKIFADVYNQGTAEHFESYVKISRTGRKCIKNDVILFGLCIYSYNEKCDFAISESEVYEKTLSQNLFLPIKTRKTILYELKKELIESHFEDVEDEYIEKAKQKALEFCEKCDTIIDEFYTIRHISGVTIVNYCVTTNEQIGETYEN